MDTVPEALCVRAAKEGDHFTPFGSDQTETPDLGEIVYVSGEEVRMLPAQPLTVADRMVELLPGVVEDMKHIFSKDGRKQSSTPTYGEG